MEECPAWDSIHGCVHDRVHDLEAENGKYFETIGELHAIIEDLIEWKLKGTK